MMLLKFIGRCILLKELCFQAKLCLLTMSLPAYNICQIQTQKALKVGRAELAFCVKAINTPMQYTAIFMALENMIFFFSSKNMFFFSSKNTKCDSSNKFPQSLS